MIRRSLIYSLGFFLCWGCISCTSFVQVQKKDLYDQPTATNPEAIAGFSSIHIFLDDFDKSVWVSPEAQCVSAVQDRTVKYNGTSSLHVKWDKVGGQCQWIGVGFGWNNWMAKDLFNLTDIAAVQLQVKSAKGTFSNLPVAFAFEDYDGVQTFYGYNKTLNSGDFNDQNWTTVTIPLSKFDFKNRQFDIEKVKQFFIQLEGDGDIYLDDIKLIQYP